MLCEDWSFSVNGFFLLASLEVKENGNLLEKEQVVVEGGGDDNGGCLVTGGVKQDSVCDGLNFVKNR